MDDGVYIAGQLASWPSKSEMADVLRAEGLTVYVGAYSVRIEDFDHFVFQEYGGDLGQPAIDADAECLDVMLRDAGRVSRALGASHIRHRFEIYDANDAVVGYLHYDWPQTPDAKEDMSDKVCSTHIIQSAAMTKSTTKKRILKFDNLDEVMADARTLLARGYESHGNWTLGQACGHLADWMRFPIDGFPVPPLPIRVVMWVMKKTVGPGMKRKILAEGFTGGMPTAPETVPDPSALTDQQGVDQLQKTIDRVMSYDAPLSPSPLFGPTDKPTHIQVSLLHAEHHLGHLQTK